MNPISATSDKNYSHPGHNDKNYSLLGPNRQKLFFTRPQLSEKTYSFPGHNRVKETERGNTTETGNKHSSTSERVR